MGVVAEVRDTAWRTVRGNYREPGRGAVGSDWLRSSSRRGTADLTWRRMPSVRSEQRGRLDVACRAFVCLLFHSVFQLNAPPLGQFRKG